MLKGVLGLLCFIAGLLLTENLLGGLVGMAAAQAVIWLRFDRSNVGQLLADDATSSVPIWNWPALAKLVHLSLPLGIVMLLISLSDNIPRYFVEAGPRGDYELAFLAR